MFKIRKINNKAMDMNTYLLIKQEEVVVIDPGMNGDKVKAYLVENEKTVSAVLLTHGHYDHIQGITDLESFLPFSIYIHENDEAMLYDSKLSFASAFNRSFSLNRTHHVIKVHHQSKLNILGEDILVIHTPGHTNGSVMYQYEQNVFSGDTLFYDSIGRTDLFSGSFNAIRRSLKMIKAEFSNNLMIYPGHGRSSKLKEIKKVNQYIK